MSAFSESIANGVEWIDESANWPAETFRGKADFLAYVFKRFTEALPQDTQLRIERVLVNAQRAVVTIRFLPMPTSELGPGYRYWWVCDRAAKLRYPLSAS